MRLSSTLVRIVPLNLQLTITPLALSICLTRSRSGFPVLEVPLRNVAQVALSSKAVVPSAWRRWSTAEGLLEAVPESVKSVLVDLCTHFGGFLCNRKVDAPLLATMRSMWSCFHRRPIGATCIFRPFLGMLKYRIVVL